MFWSGIWQRARGVDAAIQMALRPNRKPLRAILMLVFSLPGVAAAAERTAAELLPPTTVLYAALQRPDDLLELVFDHPLSQRVRETDEYQRATEKKEFLQVKAAVAAVEAEAGMPWRKLAQTVTKGGIHLGIDAATQGVAILVRSEDAKVLQAVIENLVRLARLDATSKGNPDPFKVGEYRGAMAYSAGPLNFAIHENWWVVCNHKELGKSLLDRLLDGGDSLASQPSFQAASQTRPVDGTAWTYVDVARLREAGAAPDLFRGPVDNPVAELLLGGVFGTLRQTPYATLSARIRGDSLSATLAMPHQADWVGEPREYFFGPDGTGRAPAAIPVANELFSLRTYRDISAMWQRAGDLFNAKINDDFAKADGQLATLFSGKDFGEDILGALRPELHLVVVRQTFDDGPAVPAIKLPAFALVARLKDPAKMQPELRRIFQSLVGFLNIVGAMNGQPQMELDIDKSEGKQVLSATYLAEGSEQNKQPGKINYNFSPSLAFASEWLVVSSTRGLAHTLADAVAKSAPAAGAADQAENSALRFQFATLRQLLDDNRGQLISQNMLQKGQSKEQAEREIGLMLEALGFGGDAKLTLNADQQLRLGLEVTLGKGERAK